MASTSFPPPGVPAPRLLVFLSDQVASPADFILHRLVISHLKEKQKVILATPSGDLTRWKAVASRSSVNLAQHASSGSFVSLKLAEDFNYDYKDETAWMSSLKNVHDRIRDALQPTSDVAANSSPLVILDEISLLEWMGCPDSCLLKLIRAMAALCRKFNASLIIRHHILVLGELDAIHRILLQLCSYHIEVLPLASGRSGAVSGEIALHAGHSLRDSDVKLRTRSQALQYRLTDTNVVFFERGTGAGIL